MQTPNNPIPLQLLTSRSSHFKCLSLEMDFFSPSFFFSSHKVKDCVLGSIISIEVFLETKNNFLYYRVLDALVILAKTSWLRMAWRACLFVFLTILVLFSVLMLCGRKFHFTSQKLPNILFKH